MIRAIATVSGLTGVSRILGFVRDVLIASYVGTGPVADAFFVAFRLPNLFRRLFAEGAFNSAFVPLFVRRLEESGPDAAKPFAEQTLSVLLTCALMLTTIAILGMSGVVYLLAPGFTSDPSKFELTVELSRVTIPYLVFMVPVALLCGVLNSLNRFAAAAAVPILLNVILIAALVLFVPFIGQPAHVLAWAVLAAGLGQFVWLYYTAALIGMKLRFRWPSLSPEVVQLLRLMVPGVLSAGAVQIHLIVGTIIASWRAGAVSYLYYADRIYQFPLGLIGLGFGVVLLPDLSRKLRGGNANAALERLNRGLEFSLLLTLPAGLALFVLAHPLTVVLLERGAFDRFAAQQTAGALAAFAVGLPAFVLVKIFQPAFFAREDTLTPLYITVVSVVANIVLSLVMFPYLSHIGLALATSLAMWLNAGLLALMLKRHRYFALDARCRSRLPRIAIATLVMGAAVWAGTIGLHGWFDATIVIRVLGLTVLVGGGLAVYAALAVCTGAVRMTELRTWLRPE